MKIIYATVYDILQVVSLSEAKRKMYQSYQPVFWRKASNSAELQTPYFENLLLKDNHLSLVCESGQNLTGFLFGAVVPAPGVYDPGGNTCMIDDFCISADALWENEGKALLESCRKKAALLGAIQFVIVCGQKDELKRTFLSNFNMSVVSEWYTGPL